jgi:CRISPR-associated exonuclease Cas4
VTSLAWAAAAVACLIAVLAWTRRNDAARRAVLVERRSRPEALLDADLVYMEQAFRVPQPVGLVVKLDRAYRLPSGRLVLVELKTRWVNRPFLSDVIQLSAQRMAVQSQTRQTVETYGYVAVEVPGNERRRQAHRVELMSEREVTALINRRKDILEGSVAPRYAASAKTCRSCAFRSQCDGPHLGGRGASSRQGGVDRVDLAGDWPSGDGVRTGGRARGRRDG